MNLVKNSILKTLSYYEIFDHPLSFEELKRKIDYKNIETDEFEKNLKELSRDGITQQSAGYYFLTGDDRKIKKRLDGELRAQKLMKKARWFSALIYFFPFVRAVFISGSLSKGSVPEDADIDYFIITKKHRLWIARTSLVMFKRIFLLGSKKYFCTNYYVDEETLVIPDQNIFTATEISTLIPMRGNGMYHKFLEANDWYTEYFPNLDKPENNSPEPGIGKKASMTIIEPLFFHAMAEKLDKYFMKKTYKRWMTMYGKNYSENEFELAFRSRRGTSKNHDKNYQKKVLEKVNQNTEAAMKRMRKEVINA